MVGVVLGFGVGSNRSSGSESFTDHACTLIECWDIKTRVGGLCGWCLGGFQPPFAKCFPPGQTCQEDEFVHGQKTCAGASSADPIGACLHSHNHCGEPDETPDPM